MPIEERADARKVIFEGMNAWGFSKSTDHKLNAVISE
jgi:hypothetical protein